MAKRTPEASGAGGATPATKALSAAGVPYTAHSFAADDRNRGGDHIGGQTRLSIGVEAAQALGVEQDRVFKTLIAEIDGRLWVAVVPVCAQLDLKALAAASGGKKATMAQPAQAERSSGYVVGGISPLGQRKPLPTVVDTSALRHSSIFVSGGRRGLDLELTGEDLVRVTSARTATIARPN